MKIATKITAGYGILIALMILLLIYDVSLIQHMEIINRDLSEVNFRAAIVALQLRRDLDQIKEYTEKYFVSGDPYAADLKELHGAFMNSLQKVSSLSRSEKEQTEIKRLSQMWTEFMTIDARRQEPMVKRFGSPETEDLLSRLLDHLNRLQAQTEIVMQATQQAIEFQVEKSTDAGQQAERIAWGAAAAALAVSVLVCLLVVRSISEPLNQLTEGTRAVAGGNFQYQLDTSRNDEFSQFARDFNIMSQRLSELDQMKKDFISHVSHELKAPLASTQETTRFLLEQIPGPLTEKQRRLLELNLQSGSRLSSMIANLLDLSRMEAGVMEYEFKSQDLIPLIRVAVAEGEARARERNLRLEIELPPQPVIMECDGDRFLQVVGNLLDNAMKFSPNGVAIGIRLRLVTDIPKQLPEAWRQKVGNAASEQGLAIITVSDSGPGVPDSHKELIFKKFHQVKQRKKVSGQGVGLGLAICRTIIKAHHGTIWVEDNPEGGSVFFISLPMGTVQRDEIAHRASSPIWGVSVE
ncbi:MAG: HAMP domain-containing histidine kinase [Acidobacteria bacterium]|nr:HAMP domain-containing histidine kinase [Acidobacteriota bacterium]